MTRNERLVLAWQRGDVIALDIFFGLSGDPELMTGRSETFVAGKPFRKVHSRRMIPWRCTS